MTRRPEALRGELLPIDTPVLRQCLTLYTHGANGCIGGTLQAATQPTRRPVMSRQWIRRLTLPTTAVLAAVVVPGQAQAAPYCGLAWGSQPEARAGSAPAGATLDNVRAGRH